MQLNFLTAKESLKWSPSKSILESGKDEELIVLYTDEQMSCSFTTEEKRQQVRGG